MKRKSLLFLALMALFAPLAMNGQQTNTLLTEGFESSTLNTTYQATAWYSYNAGSGNNWLFGQMGQHTGSNCAYYAYDSSNPANCYMVSMPFSVNANMTQLSVSLYQKVSGSSFPETFEVFFVKADDVTTQAAVVSATHYSAIASASYTNTDWTERTGYNTNSALAGHWVRVVVHCTSAADMYRLHIDDLTVTETTSGGGGSISYCTPSLSSTTTSYYISNFTTTGGSTNINNTTSGAGHSYSDFYENYSLTAVAGSTINFTITIAGGSTHGSAIWVDWNNDGDFSDDGERVHQTSSYSYSPHSGSFTVPANATAGDYRMRVVSDYFNSTPSDPCSADTGEFEDYKLTVSSDPYITLAPTAATVFTGFTQTLTATYGNVTGTPTITYSSSDNSVATVSGSGTTATVTGVSAGTATITATMTYQGNNYTATSTITVENPSYCTPGTGNYDNNGISNVTFGTNGVVVNNTVGGINYGDYSNLVGAVEAGTTCQVDITYKTGYTYGTIIWVDWNKNYTFEGTEAVYAGTSGSTNPTTLNATFPVPETAQTGDYRMRIIGSDMALDDYVSSLSAAANADPCGSYNYSTCHDYTLRVTPASTEPSITLAPETATLRLGSTLALTATVRNVSDPTITYTSSDNNIATVSGNGTTATVMSVAEGTVTITASMTVNGTTYTAVSTITVVDVQLHDSDGNYMSWEEFTANIGNKTTQYNNKTVYLDKDITVSTMVPGDTWGNQSTNKAFRGTFDGQGHIITFNYTADEDHEDHVALFRYVNGATFKNLIISGTINSAKQYTAAMIGMAQNTVNIENCICTATINSTYSGNEAYNAGFIANGINTLNMKGCAFTGSITGSSAHKNGGFVGRHFYQSSSYKHTFSNCLFAPSSMTASTTNSGTFTTSTSEYDIFTNSYYTQAFGTEQGKQAYSVTGVSPVIVERSGDATTYDVSGIAAYTGSTNKGLNFTQGTTTTIYAGENETVSLTLSGGDNYVASAGDLTGSGSSYSLTMAASNTVISVGTVTLTASVSPANSGTISANGNTISGATDYNHGTSVTLTANAATGYTFQNWTIDGSTDANNPTTITMDQDHTVVANFTLNQYTVSVSANPSEGGTVAGGNTYSHGVPATLTASANTGYTFVNWTKDGNEVSTDASYSFTVTEAGEYVANFEANLYTLTVAADPTNAGSVTFTSNPAGTLVPNTPATYTVGTAAVQKANAPCGRNYTFVEMVYTKTELGSAGSISSIAFHHASGEVGQQIEVYMMATTESSLSTYIPINDAVLVRSSYTLTTPDADGWVTIPLSTTFNWDGNSNLLVAVNKTNLTNQQGTASTYWYNTESINSILFSDSNSQITPTNPSPSANVVAWRPQIQFTITPTSIMYQYPYGQSVDLTATANSGYYFYNWTDGSNNTYTYNPLNVTVTEDMAYTAHFVNYKRFITAGSWNEASNWSPAGVPTASEDVAIEAAATIYKGKIGYANVIRPITHANGSITIQDGGQLVHNNASNNMVTVTVENTIASYDDGGDNIHNKGYEIVSFPVENLTAGSNAITGVFTGSEHPFDFYRFDASAEPLEWVHMASNTNINLLEGYIYASQDGTTISVTGPVMSSANYVNGTTVNFLDTDAPRFNGWALLGNPFVCNAYVSLGTNNGAGETNFYKLYNNTDYDEFIPFTNSDAVTPMGGVMFRVYDDDNIVYSRAEISGAKTGILNIDVNRTMDRGTATLDRARVRFGEGRNLEKFQFDTRHTKVYIPEGGNDFSVYYADGAGTIPVNFKAQDNGRYTLDFSTEDVGFNYLHLIDNMNGNDVDLLQTPYYAFDAKSTDFASRFTLVFATGSSTGSETGTFAFFNNGVWIINNPSTGSGAEATLQVVDVLGHILSSENISGSTSKAINVAPGVYMLRLINGDKVKVQKIVVR